MSTENYPNVEVRYAPFGAAQDITNYVYDFEVADGGIRRTAQANLTLSNPNGRFTSVSGAHPLALNTQIRIRCDVRSGIWDTIFLGNIYEDPDDYIQGEPTPRSILRVVARSLHGQRCMRETITRDFYDYGYYADDAINEMIDNPDSGNNLLITLNTDGGAITTAAFPSNPERDGVLESIQDVCEELGYVGYFDDTTGAGADTGTLYLTRYRTVPTLVQANPTIHYVLASGLVGCSPQNDMEDLANYIFVWGGTDQAFPPNDIWTEHGVARYAPAAWIAVSGTVIDRASGMCSGYGGGPPPTWGGVPIGCGRDYVRITKTSPAGQSGYAELIIPNTGYRDPYDANTTMDWETGEPCGWAGGGRAGNIEFLYRKSTVWTMNLWFFDSAGNRRQGVGVVPALANNWEHEIQTVCGWVAPGPIIADLSDVDRIRFCFDNVFDAPGDTIDIDCLDITMQNWNIDNTYWTTWNDPHIDAASISGYGRTVYHLVDNKIVCYEHAWNEGERVLRERKDPYSRIQITEGAKTWVHPSQYCQVTIAPRDIYNQDYRIEEVIHRYTSINKLLRTTVNLVAYAAEVASSKIRSEVFWGSLATVP